MGGLFMGNTDMQYTNFGLSPKAWQQMQDFYNKRMEGHPMCEICKRNPTTRVTPLGDVRACCQQCCQDIWDELRREVELDRECEEKYGW